MVANYRVSLEFAGYNDSDLDEFTGNVITSLTGNASFPTPPVTPTILGTLNSTFHDAILAAMPGGIQLTAAKNAARLNVIGALRQEASYVQTHASQNLDVLLTSGFYANSTNRAQSPLEQPVILLVENLAATQLLVRVSPITNAKSYQVRLTIAGNPPVDGGIFTQSRRIVLMNLVTGTTYTIQVRAIGGSTGSSEWSDPLSHIVT
jgi:Fibronectin type III domain